MALFLVLLNSNPRVLHQLELAETSHNLSLSLIGTMDSTVHSLDNPRFYLALSILIRLSSCTWFQKILDRDRNVDLIIRDMPVISGRCKDFLFCYLIKLLRGLAQNNQFSTAEYVFVVLENLSFHLKELSYSSCTFIFETMAQMFKPSALA